MFGIRLATALLRNGTTSPTDLADELVASSGLRELQRVLDTQFGERRDLLKARSALLALDRLTRVEDRGLAREVERILAGAHEFAELRLLGALRSGAVTLPTALVRDAELLLGDAGGSAPVRLGCRRMPTRPLSDRPHWTPSASGMKRRTTPHWADARPTPAAYWSAPARGCSTAVPHDRSAEVD